MLKASKRTELGKPGDVHQVEPNRKIRQAPYSCCWRSALRSRHGSGVRPPSSLKNTSCLLDSYPPPVVSQSEKHNGRSPLPQDEIQPHPEMSGMPTRLRRTSLIPFRGRVTRGLAMSAMHRPQSATHLGNCSWPAPLDLQERHRGPSRDIAGRDTFVVLSTTRRRKVVVSCCCSSTPSHQPRQSWSTHIVPKSGLRLNGCCAYFTT